MGRMLRGCAGGLGWMAVVVSGLYLLLTWQVWVMGRAVDGDVEVWDWFVGHRTAGWTTVVREYTFFGDPGRTSLIAIVVAGVAWWRRRSFGVGLLVVGTVLIATGLSTLTKYLVGRERPPVAMRLVGALHPSYPSGHATATTALVGVMLLVYLGSRPGRGRARGATVSAVLLVVAMCATRLYLGVHWFTDVVGGVLLGAAVVLGAEVVQIRWQVGNEPTARSLNAQQGKEI
ncbi:phosphatase PAP2 family protein [Nocardia sp.]|uniref:phosphatase PAP2 family protein n=1 Tax=Nocardia sp. TaxID=1821 RepID=UPI002633673A|nr:phosphatase PAP2 family protein [Nocardia sp.]